MVMAHVKASHTLFDLTGRVKEFIYDIESAGSRLVELRLASERVSERVGQKSQ